MITKTRPTLPPAPSPWVSFGYTMATFALLIVNVFATDRCPVAFVYTVRAAILILCVVHGYRTVLHWRCYQALRRQERTR